MTSFQYGAPASQSEDAGSTEFMLQSFVPQSRHPSTLPARIMLSLWKPRYTENSFMLQKAPSSMGCHPRVPPSTVP